MAYNLQLIMYYYSFSEYLKNKFGAKIRKLSLNAGFTCPHKEADGSGGCIFCNEYGFAREKRPRPLKDQIEKQIEEFKRKNADYKFIAYFQNATNTNASVEGLKKTYDIIRDYPDIVSLSISTRPDCVDEEKLDLIASYKDDYDVWIEYGVQTANEATLKYIKRGHTHLQTIEAIDQTHARGIKVGAHVIVGLPGETRRDMIKTAREISSLPVSGVKLHIFHVLKDAPVEDLYYIGKIDVLSQEEYVQLACDFLENTRSDIVILRLVSDSREEYLVAPKWINAKAVVLYAIQTELQKRASRQGIKVSV